MKRQSPGRWSKACSVAWANPSLLAGELLAQQQGLCGICCRPFTTEERMRVEVDHVVPVSKGGPRVIENLRTTHRACNQTKKAQPLLEARIDLGLTDTEVLRRLAGAEPGTVELLKGPRLDIRNAFLGRLDELATPQHVRGLAEMVRTPGWARNTWLGLGRAVGLARPARVGNTA